MDKNSGAIFRYRCDSKLYTSNSTINLWRPTNQTTTGVVPTSPLTGSTTKTAAQPTSTSAWFGQGD
jgi:hypothetical protein